MLHLHYDFVMIENYDPQIKLAFLLDYIERMDLYFFKNKDH